MPDPVIRLRGVWKRLGPKDVLRGVDLEVQRGESVVIIAHSPELNFWLASAPRPK